MWWIYFAVPQHDNFANPIAIDNFTTFFRVMFTATLFVVIIGSYEFVSKEIRHQGEFYRFDDFVSLIRPTNGTIPVSVGGSSPEAYQEATAPDR